jgi:hypothetical protein
MFEYFRSLFERVSSKISNKNKPDENKVTFDSDGNIINHPTGNPRDGTPAEVKALAKKLFEEVQKHRK